MSTMGQGCGGTGTAGDLVWCLWREQVRKVATAALLETHLPSQFNLVLLWSDGLFGAIITLHVETMLSFVPSLSGRLRACGFK